MAESVVSNVATRLGGLVTTEAKFLWNVEHQVNRLQQELIWMKSFLRDADSRQSKDERIRQWIAEIRDIAYDSEDVVETFALKIASGRRGGILNCIKRSACILKEVWMLHNVKSDIEEITEKITDLRGRLQTYGIKDIRDGEGSSTSSSTKRQEFRQSYPHIVGTYVVGLDDNINKLVSVLVDNNRRQYGPVDSICGMGGLGKTTLAKKVFHHSKVRSHFKYFIWAYVSEQYQKRSVWKGILTSLGLILDQAGMVDLRWEDQQLAEMLHKFLKENKCLLVLDDIWSPGDWNILRDAFPVEETASTESKILITSRNKDVALQADSRGYLLELECLTDEDGWKLFKHITFRRSTESADYGVIDKNMEELGQEMVKQCAGLPLAIVVLGGILAKKHSLIDWQIVHENVKSYLSRGTGRWGTHEVLTLSYDNLPAYLKPCFLYLSVFPEDYEIPVDRLIQLWVAEDFVPVPEREGMGEEMAEDVAERYLNELVERYMVIVGKRDAILKIKTCRMHDLVRDLCLLKSKQENFSCIVDRLNLEQAEVDIIPSSAIGTVRRLAMHDSFLVVNRIKIPHLKSALFFVSNPDHIFEKVILQVFWLGKSLQFWVENNSHRYQSKEYNFKMFLMSCLLLCLLKRRIQESVRYICKKFNLLRVVHFERVPLVGCKLLGHISSLIHLRFLSLEDENGLLCWLPSSISKLRCLQTLYITSRKPIFVPNVFWRMERLRHLYLPEDYYSRTKLKLDNLRSLQTLMNFNTKNCNLGDLSHMKNLIKLGIRTPFVVEDFKEDLKPPITTSKHLRSLSISGDESVDPRHLTYLLSICANIYELDLSVNIRKLPEPQYISSYLAYVCLTNSKLDEDPLPTLETFPKLRVLELNSGVFMGEVMVCSAKGLPLLVSLSIVSQENLEELRLNKGAMPNLQNLMIARCMKLKMLPAELKLITTLKDVKMVEMPRAFKDKLVEGGEDHYKVQHVPLLIFQNCDQ